MSNAHGDWLLRIGAERSHEANHRRHEQNGPEFQ